MKESPTPTPSDDANDPLLAALRQRLGDYGAAPPPGAWAGIRQRLPAAAPRPWWRRPRRLLPLLALLALVATTGLLRVGHWPVRLAPSAASKTGAVGSPAPTLGKMRDSFAKPARPAAAVENSASAKASFTSSPKLAGLSANRAKAGQASTHKHSANNTNSLPVNSKFTSRPLTTASALPATPAASKAPRTGSRQAVARLAAPKRLLALAAANRAKRSAKRSLEPGFVNGPARSSLLAKASQPPASRLTAATASQPTRHGLASSRKPRIRQLFEASRSRRQTVARPRRYALLAAATDSSALLSVEPRRSTLGLSARQARHYAKPGHRASPTTLRARATDAALRGLATEGLALRSARLLMAPASPLPVPLATRPDSLPPARPIRRWALMAVAGPTLSYRTLGAAPAAATTQPDFARLERPALGFGAQVQVRRVLSGRWALAVGLGYQEYATRLALQLGDSAGARHLSQRDTYRLLTLPVQLGYALGVPQGRLAKSLLVGAEAGWYQGGRSTEGSTCNCQQQAYTAASSPYRPWSLALSLGLDLRYRLGGPAGRWQWVVQPTGRYVLTSLIGPNTLGFTPRQPFSLGVLTGFSWDIR
jgi:hypothetical protein